MRYPLAPTGSIRWSAAMKRLMGLLAGVMLASCTSTAKDVSPSQSYRLAGAQNAWKITGSMDSEVTHGLGLIPDQVKRTVTIYVNGDPVINGTLSPAATGELSGTYQDRSIDTICSSEQKTPTWLDVRCMVLVDNERAATLTF
jgi:hypothetical protein